MSDHLAVLEELANDWDNRISYKRRDDYHDGMRGAYESAAEELRAAIALMRGQSELRGALVDIHAFAHRESSGPEVPDDLWTIRNMAAAALQEPAE